MTTLEKQKLIGKPARLNAGTVDETKVTISDVRNAFGRLDALVVNPLNWKTCWRALDGVKLET